MHFAVIDLYTQQAIGTLALMRIDATNGVAEIGYVTFSSQLQRTTAATEAQFLLLQYLFDTLNYRRCEWKCDHLNHRSRRAAERLGFQLEGIFRQAMVYKQRNRDTAWFAIIDHDWPAIRTAIAHWLSADNFTSDGQQKQSLSRFKASAGIE
jgi:Acetyltransferases, including N-acetylases of ribosomal proteins